MVKKPVVGSNASSSAGADGRASIGLTWGRTPDGSRLADVKARMHGWLQAVR